MSVSSGGRTGRPHTWTLRDVVGTFEITPNVPFRPRGGRWPTSAYERCCSARGLDLDGLAESIGVGPKTVERWVGGRVPRRKNQLALAAALREDVRYLWPDGLPDAQLLDVSRAELVAFYPHRSLMPTEEWLDFLRHASHHIGVLVHAGGFLAENARFLRLLGEQAGSGVRVRILLGAPDSPEVLRRGDEEGLGEGVA